MNNNSLYKQLLEDLDSSRNFRVYMSDGWQTRITDELAALSEAMTITNPDNAALIERANKWLTKHPSTEWLATEQLVKDMLAVLEANTGEDDLPEIPTRQGLILANESLEQQAAEYFSKYIKYRKLYQELLKSTAMQADCGEVIWPILKGTAYKGGDGWKDSTKEGDVTYVWNTELPKPYAAGQFPRVGNDIWSASTENFNFAPATIDEIKELFKTLSKPTTSCAEQQIERVARAIFAEYYPEGYGYGKVKCYDDAEESHKNNLRRNAKAAIQAINQDSQGGV